MSDQYPAFYDPSQQTGMASGGVVPGAADIATQLKLLVQNQSQIIQALNAIGGRSFGTFTSTATTTQTITDANCETTSYITLIDTNATAATLQRSATRLYVSAYQSGSFIVATASGGAATAGGLFQYVIETPI